MDTAILDKPVAELSTELTTDLAALSAALDTEAATIKRRKDTLHAVLVRRFEDQAKAELVKAGKDTGTVNLTTNAGKVKVEFPKEVEWDQDKLVAALDTMTPDDAKHYAKVSVKVDERKYTAAPPAIQKALTAARTVSVGKPKFTFVAAEAA